MNGKEVVTQAMQTPSVSEEESSTMEQKENGASKSVTRKLKFHVRCGLGTSLKNKRRAARKIPLVAGYWALTDRRIRPDECFTVMLTNASEIDKKHTFFIGVTTSAPDDLVEHESPIDMKNGSWLMSNLGRLCRVYEDGIEVNNSYAVLPRSREVGFCYSVVRRSNGDLHFSVNNEDLGVASKNVPENIYGYIWLGSCAKVV